MTTQVSAVTKTTTGTVRSGPCRLRALWFSNTATAGVLVVRDGGASGAIELDMTGATGAGTGNYLKLPGLGIKFNTDMHATMTNFTSVVFFIG